MSEIPESNPEDIKGPDLEDTINTVKLAEYIDEVIGHYEYHIDQLENGQFDDTMSRPEIDNLIAHYQAEILELQKYLDGRSNISEYGLFARISAVKNELNDKYSFDQQRYLKSREDWFKKNRTKE